MTVFEELAAVRKELAEAVKRAEHAELVLYDGYLRAILAGLCQRYSFETPARELLEHADRLTIAALATRKRYKAGLSPNAPPVASKPAATTRGTT